MTYFRKLSDICWTLMVLHFAKGALRVVGSFMENNPAPKSSELQFSDTLFVKNYSLMN